MAVEAYRLMVYSNDGCFTRYHYDHHSRKFFVRSHACQEWGCKLLNKCCDKVRVRISNYVVDILEEIETKDEADVVAYVCENCGDFMIIDYSQPGNYKECSWIHQTRCVQCDYLLWRLEQHHCDGYAGNEHGKITLHRAYIYNEIPMLYEDFQEPGGGIFGE
jgi:hypothetical protein